MAGKLTRTTTDHDEIRRWVDERGGWPAEVARTERGGEPGILRIDFPGFSGEGALQRISWEDWFRKFDEAKLAFTYQETTASGERSNFNKLVGRETAEARAQGKRTSRAASRVSTRGARATREAPRRAVARAAGGAAKTGQRRPSSRAKTGQRRPASRSRPRGRGGKG
jgi:hypothetical protein